jgi:putative membrane protein
MRNRILVSALLLVFVFACKKSETSTATTETSTTATSATDTSGTTTTSTSATTTSSTGGTVSNLSAEDKDFVMKAAVGGMAEVQMGQTAESKAQNADVKAFGKRMVDDHGKANDELKSLATNKGLTLPAELDKEHKDAADHLASMSGKDFDKTYMSHMVADHEKDVKEFEKAAKDAKDADIKSWASKTLPTLQDHLRQAKETQKKVK